MEWKRGTPTAILRVLDKELCDKLVQSASLTIGCNVLITDERGYVLASDDSERVGTLHEASLEVIASGQKAYHDAAAAHRLAGTRPGLTIPLFLEETVIGTIGITGSPQEVSRYAVLIQQMAQIFLSFQSQQQTSAQLDTRRQNLFREIVSFDRRIRRPEEVYSLAYELGLDLNVPRAAVLVKHCPEGAESGAVVELETQNDWLRTLLGEVFSDRQDFICPQNDRECVVLACLPEGKQSDGMAALLKTCRSLEETLSREGQQVQIGVGSAAGSLEELRQSYENAGFAVRVMQMGIRREPCLAIEELALEKLASSLSEDACEQTARDCFQALLRSPKREEVLETVEHWCRLRFHFTHTAEALHIHKSTLVYRFQRIQELYGLDMYDFERVVSLFLLDIRRRLS